MAYKKTKRFPNMAECDEFCKQPNIMLDEVYIDTEEDAKIQSWNKDIVPNVSVLLLYIEVDAPTISNSDCTNDNSGSRMFQKNSTKFGY